MKMSDPDHPLWRLLQIITYAVVLRLCLGMNAETYNEGEQMTMREMLLLFFGAEGAMQVVKGNVSIVKKSKDKDEQD